MTPANNQKGLTLIEVLFALLLLVIIAAAFIPKNWKSRMDTIRARRMTEASMLAKNKMVESEISFQGKPFNELKEEEGPEPFEAPWSDYSWKREVREIEIPPDFMSSLLSMAQGKKEGGEEGESAPLSRQEEVIFRLVTNYINKSLREVTVTVLWKEGEGEGKLEVSQLWVDFENEFSLSE